MRASLSLLVAAAAVVSAVFGAEAFSAADAGARAVSASVAGDAAAYLSLAARPGGAWSSFVSEDPATGVLRVHFGGPYDEGPAGAGVNPLSVYYFDDILQVTNQGSTTVFVQVVAESYAVCFSDTLGAMTNGCYGGTTPATAAELTVGAAAFVGIAVDSSAIGSVADGPSAGAIRVYACRAAVEDCASG